MARSLTDDVRQMVPLALAEVRTCLRNPSDCELEQIAMALGRQIGLIRIGLAEEAKTEWISIVLSDLQSFPADMVMEALERVRRTIKFEGEVLPAVLDLVQPKVSRLESEMRTLERLAEMA